MTKTQLQQFWLTDVKDEQFERERTALANKKELIKLEAEASEKKLLHWKIK